MNLRAFRNEDLPEVLALLRETMIGEAIPESRFVRQVLLDPNFKPEGTPVAVEDNRVVGFALGIARQVPLENAPSDADRGYITLLGVLPKYQRRGIGSALLRHVENYLRNQQRKTVMISSYAPGYFLPGVDVKRYETALNLLAKNGYKEIYRPIAMECPLWQMQIPEWVPQRQEKLARENVIVENWRSELTLPALEFAKTEFAGDWVRFVRQAIDRILSGDSPTRLIIAREGGKVLGISHYDAERFGPIGVAQTQRGRGIGQVLMYRTLLAQRDCGYRVAYFMWSDDKTAARLYTAAGFREARRFALMKKELL